MQSASRRDGDLGSELALGNGRTDDDLHMGFGALGSGWPMNPLNTTVDKSNNYSGNHIAISII